MTIANVPGGSAAEGLPPPEPPRPPFPPPWNSLASYGVPGVAPPYRRPGRIWALLHLALVLSIVTATVAAADALAARRTIGRLLESPTSISVDQIATADNRRVALGWVTWILMAVTFALMIRWTRRLYGNLPALGVTDLRFGVGWAVGGWLVPLLNFVRPKQIVDDIWRGSDAALTPSWRGAKVPTLLHLWWALWIGGVLIKFGASNEPTDLESLDDALARQMVGLGTYVILGLVTLVVVRRLTDRQEQAASLRLAVTPSPRRFPTAALLAVPAALAVVAFAVASAVLDSEAAAQPVANHAVLAADLKVGDCFNQPEALISAPEGEMIDVIGIDLIRCDQPHDSEIYALVEHPAATGDKYPGEEALMAFADEACLAAFDDAIGVPYAESVLQLTYLTPGRSWAQGDRTVRCAATHPLGPQLDASVLGSNM